MFPVRMLSGPGAVDRHACAFSPLSQPGCKMWAVLILFGEKVMISCHITDYSHLIAAVLFLCDVIDRARLTRAFPLNFSQPCFLALDIVFGALRRYEAVHVPSGQADFSPWLKTGMT